MFPLHFLSGTWRQRPGFETRPADRPGCLVHNPNGSTRGIQKLSPALQASRFLCLHPSIDRTSVKQAPVPEAPGYPLTVLMQLLLRLARRTLPQKLLVFLMDLPWAPWLPLVLLAVVPGRLFVRIT